MIYEYRKMKTAYLSSAYLAPVEYYTKLVTYDKIYIEQHDHYMKQTYRNRCTIAGPEAGKPEMPDEGHSYLRSR